MALQATLILENKCYDILDLDYEIYKPSDHYSNPSATPVAGTVNFSMRSPMNQDTLFQEWALRPAEMIDCKFILPLTNGIDHVTRTIDLYNAHCLRLSESFSSYSESQVTMRLTVATSKITFNDSLVWDGPSRKVERKK